MKYQPPYTITPEILNRVAAIGVEKDLLEAHRILIASPVFHCEFEFIHPFADGNGRLGRLWQSLILARWNPLFTDIPVESLIFEYQAEYYQALQKSTRQADKGRQWLAQHRDG